MNAVPASHPKTLARKRASFAILGALSIAAACLHFASERGVPFATDSRLYQAMAEGRMATVPAPFTHRILLPWIARQLRSGLGLALEDAFRLVGMLGLVTLVASVVWLMQPHLNQVTIAAAILVTPAFLALHREIFLSDGLHAALIAACLLALHHQRWVTGLVLLFLLQLTRESTLLFSCFLIGVWAVQRKWKPAAGAGLATVAGMAVVGGLAGAGQSNIHQTNPIVYMLAKIPFNFLTNVCGVRMWTNTHAAYNQTAYADPPMVFWDLPTWFPTGSVHQIGIYKLDLSYPLWVTATWLTLFGVLPTLVLLVFRRRSRHLLRDRGLSFPVLVAALYGTTCFLIGPLLGAGVERLVTYGWPCFWIAVPALLHRYFSLDSGPCNRLAILHSVACWTPFVARRLGIDDRTLVAAVSLAIAVPCHAATLLLARRTFDTGCDFMPSNAPATE